MRQIRCGRLTSIPYPSHLPAEDQLWNLELQHADLHECVHVHFKQLLGLFVQTDHLSVQKKETELLPGMCGTEARQ